MRKQLGAVLIGLLVPAFCWAGVPDVTRAPTMDEGGLIMLGLALAGSGIALLRGTKR